MAAIDRSARRAALRATHPDLGGDVEDFIATVRAFDGPVVPRSTAAPAWGSGAAVPTTRPTITTTRWSRAARRARRTRRRLRAMTRGWLPAHQYAHLLEERP